jgi:ssDNA-binding Zn-finger/Zn-ribbon topoisomerase 1
MVFKQSKYGRFIGCSGYLSARTSRRSPSASHARRRLREADRAALEAGPLVLRLRQLSDVPLRRLAAPVATPCPKCGAPFLTQRGGRGSASSRAGARAATTGETESA